MESNYLSWSLILISLVLASVSLASSEWTVSAGGNGKIGLWKECVLSGGSYSCFNTRDKVAPANLSGIASPLSDSAQKKILFLRIGASAAVGLLLIALFSNVFMMEYEHMHMFSLVSLVLSIALSIVVSIVWATDKTLGKVRASQQSLSLGWYLQLSSILFSVIAFALLMRGGEEFIF